jgi:hypothetical protein
MSVPTDSRSDAVEAPKLPPDDDMRMLRMIYRLARRERTSEKQRSKLISEMEGRIAMLEKRNVPPHGHSTIANFGCAAFGAKSPKDLTEIFVEQLEKMVVRHRSFKNFRDAIKIAGYRSRVRGKLFHLFVRNFAPLHVDFYQHAITQVAEINDPTSGTSLEPGTVPGYILNAKGEEIPRQVIFCLPKKAWDICIIKKNGKRVEFVDDMYVSHADDNGVTLWSFLCEIEVKTAGAAGGFGKQIGFSQTRMGHDDVAFIELRVEGFSEPVRVMPMHIVLSARTIDRNAISFLGKKSWAKLGEDIRSLLTTAIEKGNLEEIYVNSEFRFQKTKRGNGEVFRRITLAINNDFFDRYVNAIWPIITKTRGVSSNTEKHRTRDKIKSELAQS